ncbi:MAG: hypothetical protein AAGA78_14940 [Pseudomonadota bacterium]
MWFDESGYFANIPGVFKRSQRRSFQQDSIKFGILAWVIGTTGLVAIGGPDWHIVLWTFYVGWLTVLLRFVAVRIADRADIAAKEEYAKDQGRVRDRALLEAKARGDFDRWEKAQ